MNYAQEMRPVLEDKALEKNVGGRGHKTESNWITLQKCARDGYQLVMQGLASVVRVAQGKDAKYALAAGEFLVEYGERLLAEKAAQKQLTAPEQKKLANREEIIAELRGLYAKALGTAPLIVEAQVETPAGKAAAADPPKP